MASLLQSLLSQFHSPFYRWYGLVVAVIQIKPNAEFRGRLVNL